MSRGRRTGSVIIMPFTVTEKELPDSSSTSVVMDMTKSRTGWR